MAVSELKPPVQLMTSCSPNLDPFGQPAGADLIAPVGGLRQSILREFSFYASKDLFSGARTQDKCWYVMVIRRVRPTTRDWMAGFSMLVAIAFGYAAPAEATEAPDITICDDIPDYSNGKNRTDERTEPITLPADWVAVATSSRNWIAVWTEYSRTYCVETTGMREATNLERFGERFLGFNWGSREGSGYVLIDRARQGDMIDTGSKPHFSPDGSKVASLHRADTGKDGFDGFAIWQTKDNLLVPLIVNAGPPLLPRYDWKIDRWEGEHCLHILSVSSEWNGGNKAAIPYLPRYRFVASASNDWEIIEGIKCPIVSSDDDSVTLPSAGAAPSMFDWAKGIVAFAAALQNSPLIFTIRDAAGCYGRWMLHAKAIDEGGST